jgi:hypothetical protein
MGYTRKVREKGWPFKEPRNSFKKSEHVKLDSCFPYWESVPGSQRGSMTGRQVCSPLEASLLNIADSAGGMGGTADKVKPPSRALGVSQLALEGPVSLSSEFQGV